MNIPLKRDMEFIRALLLEIEGGRRVFETLSSDTAEVLGVGREEGLPPVEAEKIGYHLRLLEDAGFVTFSFKGLGGTYMVEGITWHGHEFLDSVRDNQVWTMTKKGAEKAGNASVAFLWELAKAYGKQVAMQRLGISLSE